MISVVIIGTGNVGQHLISAFAKSEKVDLIQVYSRKPETAVVDISKDKVTHDFTHLKEADLYIISVSDNAITEVSSQIPFENRLVVHTSGTVPMSELNDKNRKGVFLPITDIFKKQRNQF